MGYYKTLPLQLSGAKVGEALDCSTAVRFALKLRSPHAVHAVSETKNRAQTAYK